MTSRAMLRKQQIKDKIYELERQMDTFEPHVQATLRFHGLEEPYRSFVAYRELRAYKLALEWVIEGGGR